MLTLENFNDNWNKKFPGISLRNNHFLLATSGGLDSTTLVYLMHLAGATCSVAHVNYQLREEDSNQDEQFVTQLSALYNFPCFIKKTQTTTYAQTHKMGIQQAAREIRYTWFTALLQEIKATTHKEVFLITAHHSDDQVETVLMQLFRGTGLNGLTGIPEIRMDDLKLIRPLLTFSKIEIAEFAKENSVDFREDSSNLKNDYTRNLIRNKIIPQMEEVFPTVTENILETLQRLKEADQIVTKTVADFWKKGIKIKKGIQVIPVSYFEKVKNNNTYLWELIKQYGFGPKQIKEVQKLINAQTGAYIETETYRFIKWQESIQLVAYNLEKEYSVLEKGVDTLETIQGNLHFDIKPAQEITIDPSNHIAYLAADNIQWPLMYRTWEKTDYFYPLGLGKKKKLTQFLGSLKLSPSLKEKVTVLTMGDKILWVVGKRIDDRFQIKPSTKEVLIITLSDKGLPAPKN